MRKGQKIKKKKQKLGRLFHLSPPDKQGWLVVPLLECAVFINLRERVRSWQLIVFSFVIFSFFKQSKGWGDSSSIKVQNDHPAAKEYVCACGGFEICASKTYSYRITTDPNCSGLQWCNINLKKVLSVWVSMILCTQIVQLDMNSEAELLMLFIWYVLLLSVSIKGAWSDFSRLDFMLPSKNYDSRNLNLKF